MSTKTITSIGIFTAVTCIIAPLAVPIGPVPISLTNMIIYLGIYILGTKLELLSCLLYLLIGLLGIPVFSGFTGGPQKLFGPTGGYLAGFIVMTAIAGFFIEKSGYKMLESMIGMLLGTAACYALGTAWLAMEAGMTFQTALMAGVVPFIAGDIIKMLLVAGLAPSIRKNIINI